MLFTLPWNKPKPCVRTRGTSPCAHCLPSRSLFAWPVHRRHSTNIYRGTLRSHRIPVLRLAAQTEDLSTWEGIPTWHSPIPACGRGYPASYQFLRQMFKVATTMRQSHIDSCLNKHACSFEYIWATKKETSCQEHCGHGSKAKSYPQ